MDPKASITLYFLSPSQQTFSKYISQNLCGSCGNFWGFHPNKQSPCVQNFLYNAICIFMLCLRWLKQYFKLPRGPLVRVKRKNLYSLDKFLDMIILFFCSIWDVKVWLQLVFLQQFQYEFLLFSIFIIWKGRNFFEKSVIFLFKSCFN